MSQSSSPNRKDNTRIRQTMFQFLKRKKHIQLQNSLKLNNQLNRSTYKQSKKQQSNTKSIKQSNKKNHHGQFMDNIEHHTVDNTIGNFSVTQRNSFINNNNKYHSTNITPKKILFSQNYQTIQINKNSSRKPLIQMISPLKNQIYNKYTNISDNKQHQSSKKQQNIKGILKNTSYNKSNTQSYTKKKLNTSLNTLKNAFLSMYQAGKSAKQKSSNLSICLINLVKDMNLNDKTTNKKLGEIKFILKSIESSFQHFNDNYQAEELIEQFHKNLAEHLNTIESQNSQNYQKQKQYKIQQIQKQKNQQINQLKINNQKLNRQVQRYMKKIQKVQNQLEKLKQDQQNRQINMLENIQTTKKNYEEKQTAYKKQIQQLNQLLKDEIQKFKQIQKKLKNYVYSQQKSIKQKYQTLSSQQSARQNFLLQQIQHLKQQFSSDISKLHSLYQSKLQQNDKKITLLQNMIQRQKHQRTCDRSISDKILQEANIHRNQMVKVSKKNEEILRDLYRMNQQLYQHWLALKDIKTLSERIHVFQHFQRIYKDLAFNPRLFQL